MVVLKFPAFDNTLTVSKHKYNCRDMKVIKIVVFLGLILYWITSMNEGIKGEGIFGSLLGIVVLAAFIYGAYSLFFNNDSEKKK